MNGNKSWHRYRPRRVMSLHLSTCVHKGAMHKTHTRNVMPHDHSVYMGLLARTTNPVLLLGKPPCTRGHTLLEPDTYKLANQTNQYAWPHRQTMARLPQLFKTARYTSTRQLSRIKWHKLDSGLVDTGLRRVVTTSTLAIT